MSAEHRPSTQHSNLREELPLMSIALLMGFLIWIIAATQTTEAQRYSIPLRVVGQPDNVQMSLSETRVDVELTMPTSLVGRVSGDDFEITIDLSDAARHAGLGQAAEWDIPITLSQNVIAKRDPSLLNDITFADPYPAECTVSAQLLATPMDIRPNLVGDLPPGQHVEGEVTPEPTRLWVTTASATDLPQLVGSATGLLTEPIDLSNLGPGTHTLARLPELPEGVRVIGISDPENGSVERVASGTLPEITVTLTIQEDIVQRRFAGIEPAMEEILLAEGLELSGVQPARFTVTLEGTATALETISDADVILTAPLLATLIHAGTSALQVEAHLGEGVDSEIRDLISVVEVQPGQVDVTLAEVTSPDATE